MMNAKKLIILVILMFQTTFACSREQPSTLFCVYTKTEAVDLTETIRSLAGNARILAFGTAREHLKNEFSASMISIEGTENIGNKECPPEQTLDVELIGRIVSVAEKYLVFVTGFGSQAQIDILQQLHAKHLTTCVGYYDPFQSMKDHKYAAKINEQDLDALMVTCNSLKEECQKLYPSLKIETVGKYDMDAWTAFPKEKSLEVLEKAELHWNPDHTTVLYAGGHADYYRDDFRLFLESIQESATEKSIDVWVTLSPDIRCDGKLEAEEIERLGIKNVTIAKKGVPTLHLLPFADVFLSATSGAVVNANACGVKGFYVTTQYNNYLIDKGIAQKAANKEEFRKIWNSQALSQDLRLEIPENASQNITHFVKGVIAEVELGTQ